MYIRTIESKLTNVYTNLQGEIKKRRQAEEELQLAYNQMEVKVKERTSELRNEVTERKKAEEILQKVNTELETTIEKLKTANRELEQFAFITSHHLSEPVRKILTFASVLTNSLKDKLNDDEFENLMYMTDGANKIAQMVKGLKLYLHASKDKTEFEYINLNSILERLKRQELAERLEQSNGTILVPETLPTIKGSSIQISQVLQHIIENSIKFRKEKVSPEIVVKSYEEKNEMVRIEIKDNGVGIKEKYIKDIFNPFKLLNTEHIYDGVGIGLTICKKVIEKHGGQMGAKSVYGHGTTLWFTLPLALCETKQESTGNLIMSN
jgi:light-regulated signal transduction histidine kinase (bacteriophytochrome)